MESNNLDKFFKDKFEDRSFEWDEKYWASAQEAIEAADAGKPRRRLFVWWIWLLAFVLLSTGLGAYFMNRTDLLSAAKQSETNISDISTDENKAPENDLSEFAVVSETAQTVQNSTREKELTEAKNAIQPSSVSTTSNSTVVDAPSKGDRNTPIAKTLGEKVPEVNLSDETPAAQTNQFTEKNLLEKSEIDSQQSQNLSPKQGLPVKGQDVITDKNPILNSLPFLPILPYEILWEQVNPELQLVVASVNSEESIEVQKEKKWHVGIGMYGGLSRLEQEDTASVYQKNISGGIIVQRRLLQHWYLSTGLNYQVAFAQYDTIGTRQQYEMGFGLDQNQLALRPTIIHSLSVPLGIQYAAPKGHRLELGAIASYQLGAHGGLYEEDYLFPWERTEEQQNELERQLINYYEPAEPSGVKPAIRTSSLVESGWLGADDLRTLNLSAYFNYRYQISPNFELGLEANYRLQPLFNNGTGKGALGFGLRLNYWIF